MKRKINLGLRIILVLTMIFSMSTVSLQAQTLDITAPMTFDNSASTRKDISSYLPEGTNDTMIWSGAFKTADSAIQTLVSVCNNDANQYLTLYVMGGNKIGFEFKGTQTASASANVSYLDDNYHTFKLTVSPNGYVLEFDGDVVISDNALAILTSMNSYTNKSMYLGAMHRQGGANDSDQVNWYFNGTMKDVVIRGVDSTLQVQPDLVFSGADFSSGDTTKLLTNQVPDFIKTMEKGSFSFTYRLDEDAINSGSLLTLFSIMDTSGTNNYATFYVKPTTGQFGIEAREGFGHKFVNFDTDRVKNNQWHTVTFVFDGTNMIVTLDDLSSKKVEASGFISGASWSENANALLIGGMQRNANQWYFNGYMGEVKIYDNVLAAGDISKLHASTASATYPNKNDSESQSAAETIYAPGYQGSKGYRIPSLLTTSAGTTLAGIDQRHDGLGDWYNIDSLVRRKVSGADSFGDPIKAIDLIDYSDKDDAFLIDMSLMEATLANGNKRVYMLVDMFPQSVGLVDSSLTTGSGYKDIAGKKYLAVYDNANKEYTVRENGMIYDANDKDTGYKMTVAGNQDIAYRDLGTIADASGKNCGNAYVYSGSDEGVFHVLKTSYLWLTYSDDDGQTWSSPKDLNGQVKADWMKFLGTGPGVGIQLSDDSTHPGRLVYPVYHSNVNLGGSQASAIIVSDDFGETWTLKNSPIEADGFDSETMNDSSKILTESQVVELNNGTLKLFMRNYSGKVRVSTSNDGGDTWSASSQIDVFDSYCQLSAIHVNYQGKEYVIISNPSASNRQNLAITVGLVDGDKITWGNKHIYHQGHGQYSCLSDLGNGMIGVLYEGHDDSDALNINYRTFSMDYLLSDIDLLAPQMNTVNATLVKAENNSDDKIMAGDKWVYTVTFSKPVFISGEATLPLDVAGINREAMYISGNGTTKMTFSYTVQDDDIDGSIYVKKALNVNDGVVVESFYNVPFTNSEGLLAGGNVGIDFSSAANDLTIKQAIAGSEGFGATSNAYDKNNNTIWHSSDLATGWITLDLGKVYSIEGLRYLPRQDSGSNGTITKYNIYVGTSSDNMTKVVSDGTWSSDRASWKGNKLATPVNGRYIKLEAVAGLGNFASAAEIAVFGQEAVNVVDKTTLQKYYDQANDIDIKDYTTESVATLKSAMDKAKTVLNNPDASQADVDEASEVLLSAYNGLEELAISAIKNSAISADALYSESNTADKMFDNDLLTYWESPYTGASAALPQDVIMSLDGTYKVEKLSFTSHTIKNGGITQYAIATSTDGKTWSIVKEGTVDREKYLQSVNVTVNVRFDPVEAKYIKLTALKAVGRIESEEDTYARIAEMQLFGTKVITLDKSALQATLKDVEALKEADYTSESWKELATALTKAQAVLDDKDAKQAEIDEANTALTSAIDNLVKRGDKKALQATVKSTEALKKADYTSASWKELATALTKAQAVLDDKDAKQAEIDEANTALTSAIDNLVKRGDKKALQATLKDVEALKEADYTSASWKELATALTKAQAVLDDKDAKQAEIDEANTALTSAINSLEKRGDKKALQATLKDVEALKEADYTSESWKELATALTKAQAILDDKDAKQAEIDKANTALTSAIDNLVKRGDKKALQATVKSTEALKEADYTSASWKELATALTKAQAVLDDKDAKQAEIEEANKLLTAAIDSLKKIDVIVTPGNPSVKPNEPTTKPEQQAPTTGVKTGDRSNVMELMGLLGLSSVLFAISKKRKDFID